MKKLSIKPFTLITLLMVLLFLAFFPVLIIQQLNSEDSERTPIESLTPIQAKWTGMIKLWDMSYINSGTGNHTRWLNSYIRAFEKVNPGVYVSVRNVTNERLKIYLGSEKDSSFLPDIIALDPYRSYVNSESLVDLTEFFEADELDKLHPASRECVTEDGKIYGVPWMMGSCGYIINLSLLQENNLIIDDYARNGSLSIEELDNLVKKMSYEKKTGKKTINYYGFNTYTTDFTYPILSMIYNRSGKIENKAENKAYDIFMDWYHQRGIINEGFMNAPFYSALSLFTDSRRAAVMLGGSNVIYTLKRLQEKGKAFDYAVYPISSNDADDLYIDQIASFGLYKSDNPEKTNMCISFLKGMLKEEHQLKLKDIGMFSVIKDIDSIYEDDEPMSMLEKSLKSFKSGPSISNKDDIDKLLEPFKDSGA